MDNLLNSFYNCLNCSSSHVLKDRTKITGVFIKQYQVYLHLQIILCVCVCAT